MPPFPAAPTHRDRQNGAHEPFKPQMRRILLTLALLAALTSPAAAQDHIASPEVELLSSDRSVNHAMIAAVAGDRLFVGGPATLSVFDISTPESPQLLGAVPAEGANEAEDVVTDGKLLALATPACPASPNGCVNVYDVTGTSPQKVSTIPANGQIAACIAGCRYLWVTGPNAIYDLADPSAPEEIGSFEYDDLEGPCFQAREVRPGIVLVACDPVLLFSTLPEHGATPAKPKLLARGAMPPASFVIGGAVHSAHWPQAGADRFLLTSLETPFNRECTEDVGAFITWDARAAGEFRPGARFTPIDQWRPTNGTFTDGRSPYNAIGCSPHFLDEHPTFANGGLVAQAALENGLRFLEVGPDGAITERGWFLGAGGTASTPVWHPNGQILYLADYARGLDVLRWTGPTFVPPGPAAPGTSTAPPSSPPASAPAARRLRLAGAQAPKKGRPSLVVEVPGAGRLSATVRTKGRFRGAIRAGRATPTEAGLVRLPLSLPAKAAAELRRRGRLALDVRLDWRPAEGARERRRSAVTLRRGR